MPVNSFENYPMTWKPNILKNGAVPLHIEIAEKLEHDIRDGVIQPNEKLPPQRELADYLDVNLSTIAKAFKLCAAKGLISGETGRGTYVSSDVLSNLPMLDETGLEHCINLGASHPIYGQNHYVSDMLKLLLKRTNTIANIYEYSGITSRKSHKQSGVRWLRRFGIETEEDRILLTCGLQNALAVTLASLFQYGDKIATNSVIYPGIKNIANNLGIQLLSIPYIDQSMDLNSLVQICKHDTIKGIYLIPDHHNPTTVYMEQRERAAVAEIIRENRLICIEDGTYSFLNEEPHIPVTALIPERSVYISSVSNALSPGFRIAFVYMPPDFTEQMITGNSNINVMAPPLEAEVVSQLIESGTAEKMMKEKKEELLVRNKIVDAHFYRYHLYGSACAQFRWLLLPRKWTGKKFEQAAKERGVQVFGSERFVVGKAAVSAAVRLAVSTPKSLEHLEQGACILAGLLKSGV